jgi:DDE superfamily endonuclease
MQLAAQHPDWVLGVAGETWWSRVAHPPLHAWTDPRPLRLVGHVGAKGDPDPKALGCYGVWRTDRAQALLRFVEGRPGSHVTTAFLAWLVQPMTAGQKRVWVLTWDNASWHISREVRPWIRQPNPQANPHGGVRLLTCRLPVKSPWLNPLEPRWVHGKRAVVEPARLRTAPELISRVYAYVATEQLESLKQEVA